MYNRTRDKIISFPLLIFFYWWTVMNNIYKHNVVKCRKVPKNGIIYLKIDLDILKVLVLITCLNVV